MKSPLLSSFFRNVELTPEKTALVDKTGRSQTYSELSKRTAALRNLFPIDEPRVVGIYLDYDSSLIEAIVAVIRSGASVVTVQPDRNISNAKAYFLNRGVEFVITTPQYSRMLSGFLQIHLSETALQRAKITIEDEDVDENITAFTVDDRKYKHSEIATIAKRMIDNARLSSSDTVLLASDVSSSGFISELFGTFISGGTLVVLPSFGRYDGRKALEYAEAEGVTVVPAPEWLRAEVSSRRLSVSSKIRFYADPSLTNTKNLSKTFRESDIV